MSRRDKSWCTESRHLIISISSIDSTPLLDFSDSPSITSIAPATHSTWDRQNHGKTGHRQSGTLTSANTITREEEEDTGTNLKVPGRSWKMKSRRIHRHVSWQLVPDTHKPHTRSDVGNQLTCLPPCEASISAE